MTGVLESCAVLKNSVYCVLKTGIQCDYVRGVCGNINVSHQLLVATAAEW